MDPLAWIDTQEKRMLGLLENWAAINSFSGNPQGLQTMLEALTEAFAPLGGTLNYIKLPTGKALHITMRPEAPYKVLFGGHMDTVYPPETHWAPHRDNDKILGPGVADMKGGLVILLIALEAFERSPKRDKIGWEVLITPDEETGSHGSKDLWIAATKRNHSALLFEPAFPDGAIVDERGGSATWTLTVEGVAAHAGREFHKGRSAIVALARYIQQAHSFNGTTDSIVNVGYISGGGPVNIVADAASCRINARVKSMAAFGYLNKAFEDLALASSIDGIVMRLHLDNYRPPKRLTPQIHAMLDTLATCAKEEGYELPCRSTSGVCDGNNLEDAGLPVVDTLGVVGGELHTPREYAEIPSLRLRARLVTRYLMHL